jgi:hypothetical protein
LALKACPECGVPEIATSENLWFNNGDIVHSRDRSSRLVFIETENLDPLFRGIEQIIGVPIEHMIITTARRANRVYTSTFVPETIREKIQKKEIDYESFITIFSDVGKIYGFGSYDLVGLRYEQDEDDYNTLRITEPYSLPMTIAAHVGAIEMLTGVESGYKYEEVSPGVHEITVFPSPHREELKERLWFQPYQHHDGDLELERCATCGGPSALSGFQWHQDRGIIVNKNNGRRMVIQGNALLDPVFKELEEELGDAIPRAVVEAQRQFAKGGFYTLDDITEEGNFRTQLALRGIGNLKELTMKRKGMHMRLENVALPYIIIGLAQGFFEIGFGQDSSDVDWELFEDGALEMTVKPR